jgi:dihydrofolate synthase / folylpolyglutamate synthase
VTYAEAVARLLALRGGEHAGMRPGLERIETLLAALDHPEDRMTLVQVGGTNGKGSVCAMLAAMLKAAGRRTGLYTSPHLVSFRERIRVDGEPIPEDAVADGVETIGTLVARLDATMFEASTALAFDHFAREAVDVAVLEVGLGGRLDATTVGRPAVTILSRIDLDHEAILGPTVDAIAREKAAIIRSGLAISAAQSSEAATVIARRADEARVSLVIEGRELHVQREPHALQGRGERDRPSDDGAPSPDAGDIAVAGQIIACSGPGWRLDHVFLPQLGTFQPSNALLAVAAAKALGVTESAIREGLDRVRWPGRLQVVGSGPWLVLDGAHNPAGARALADSLREAFGRRPLTLITAVLRDKNARGILAELVPLAERVILTRSSSARSAEPGELRREIPEPGPPVEIAASVPDALELARRPSASAVTCVAGSLSLVGDALRHLQGGRDIPCPIEKGAASIAWLV